MNDRPASLVNYLLTYLNTEHALLGSRRRFDVNGLVKNWVPATRIEF